MTMNPHPTLNGSDARLVDPHAATGSRGRVRVFMLVEALSFFVAALVHRGVLIAGREHTVIHVGETFMGAVLVGGVVASALARQHAWIIAFGTQAFAFFGTIIGLVLIASGLGPHSIPGLMFNAAVLLLLSLGLFFAARTP